ncbi:MAG: hypothetical protein ACOYN2_02840 [Patescibacteria group bacterium]
MLTFRANLIDFPTTWGSSKKSENPPSKIGGFLYFFDLGAKQYLGYLRKGKIYDNVEK